MYISLFFFFYLYCDHRDLHVLTHSFPTLRSSYLSARTSKCIGWFVRLFMVPRQTDNRPHTKMAFVQTVMQAISGGPHLPAIRLINTCMGQYCAARVLRGRSLGPMQFGTYEVPGEAQESGQMGRTSWWDRMWP